MTQKAATTRNVRIFRYDPATGDSESGHFDSFKLEIPDESTTTILDVLLRVQREQDASVSFRYACRVNMCGSCAMVINGKEALACKTNVSHIPRDQEITIRPLNHFPVIKDLVVDMEPFFRKYEECLPFYGPKEDYQEPVAIRPDSQERKDIGLSTECIACGCCVSSCTMCHYHDGYAGPAALNRAFTLLADSRDGLFDERLTSILDSCYNCRTEFNCTEVCPKGISGTRAIKYIQLLALKQQLGSKSEGRSSTARAARLVPAEAPVQIASTAASASLTDSAGATCNCSHGAAAASCSPSAPKADALGTPIASASAKVPVVVPAVLAADMDRRSFLHKAGIGIIGAAAAVVLGGVATSAVIGPTLAKSSSQWVPVASLDKLTNGDVTTVVMSYDVKSGLYKQQVSAPVLVSRMDNDIVCFKANCPHLGCIVKWEGESSRFRCACHGGVFDRSGKVLGGPPPRPLDRYTFKVDSGHLLVEVS